MVFKAGDRVKYNENLMAGAQRQGQIGTIIRVMPMPTSDGPRVDIQFGDGVDRGITVHQIEHA